MSEKRKRYILPEEEIPHYWYNIQGILKQNDDRLKRC